MSTQFVFFFFRKNNMASRRKSSSSKNKWVIGGIFFFLLFLGIIICIIYNSLKKKSNMDTNEGFKVLGELAKFDRTDVLPSGDLIIRRGYSDGIKYAEQADPKKYLKGSSIGKQRWMDGLFTNLSKTGGDADFPNCTVIGVNEALRKGSNDPMIEAGKIERECEAEKQCYYDSEYRPDYMSFDDFMNSCKSKASGRIA